ncbi:hypothetical protein [Streptomyces canus]|uniref:hypothetical protein n=1 Tax=Streptomyces canus TaxID=58343 RepID=UPI002DDC54CB|nr:hypothetical protein [Streptomyces canus]WSD83360.1 hypothetical protein OG925_03195 [Streptomyces canus]
MLAAVALMTAGCSGDGDGTDASAATPSGTGTATAAPTTPSATPSPPYPTNAKGCHPNGEWTTEQATDWVRIAADAPDAGVDTSKNPVTIHESVEGYSGPLCETVTVQVEFWKLTYGSAGAGEHTTSATEAPPDYYFDMNSVKRTELRVDGRKELLVKPPEKLYAGDRSVCVGALVAVYVGKPLKSKELPEQISTESGGLNIYGGDVEFRTERVAEYELSPPAAPHVCSPEGKPTADPNDVPDTTGVPDPLYPTPTFSFDVDDVLRSPSYGD